MAKTLEQTVQDALGAQLMTICQLQAELGKAQERIAEFEAEKAKAKQAADGPHKLAAVN